ncbi:MAG: glycosyltransferase family 9 protein [Ignavibacteriaceae bacterium]
MALSMLHEIDKKYPDAEITWICGKVIAPLINSVERINTVIVIDDYKLLKGSFLDRLNVISKIWFRLALKKYDIVINAYRNKGYELLTLTVIKKALKSFSGKDRKNQMVPGRYHAAEYARLIHEIDDWQMPEPVIPKINPPPDSEIAELVEKFKTLKIILTPGGAQNLINGGIQRRWSIEHYYLLAKSLITKFDNCSIILAGSKDDELACSIFKDLPVISLIGKTTLLSLINLYKRCDLLITHDTGLLHIAKLTDIHTIALFGPVNPVERTGKDEKIDSIWIGNELPCSPCYNGKSFADCKNNICMKNISVEMVLNKIIEAWNKISYRSDK